MGNLSVIAFLILVLSNRGKASKCGETVNKADDKFAIHQWSVGLMKKPTIALGTPKVFCQGTIVSKKDVITAAHCLTEFYPQYLAVSLKYANICKNDSDYGLKAVKTITIHPLYAHYVYYYDIGIVTIKEIFEETPICLPHPKDKLPQKGSVVMFDRINCIAQCVDMKIYSEKSCIQNIARQTPYFQVKLRDLTKSFCAADPDGNQDTCYGDSGGAFQSTLDGRLYILTGVTSLGFGCHRGKVLGVYTDVKQYVTWISENTLEKVIIVKK